MLHSVVSQLLPYITALNFADKVGGIVYPLQQQKIDKNGLPVNKILPVYGNDPTVCKNDPYIDMLPDSDKKSVIYFESTAEGITRCNPIISQSTLTLVAWFNLKKINAALKSGESMLRLLAATLQGEHNFTISGMTVHAVLTLQQVDFRNPAIFSKWSINEANKQYTIYPHDFGSIQFDVQLNYALCDEEPVIDPGC